MQLTHIARSAFVASIGIVLTTAFGLLVWSKDAAINSDLDQGWSKAQRTAWYESTQGSRLIPAAWLRALEQPDSKALFLEPSFIASFGYLLRSDNASGPLPVGFAIDVQDDTPLKRTRLRWKANQKASEPWVGLTCSACHTGHITFKGKSLRIDGGSAIANLQAFMAQLNRALEQTSQDADKWQRFAARVLNQQQSAKNQALLKDAYAALLEWQLREAKINKTDVEYGPGRIDAFGRIFNKVALLLKPDTVGNEPNAPVSIPHIWRAPQMDRVQYNGIAPKVPILFIDYDIGALGRNTGEIIGVFGDVVAKPKPGLSGFVSSVRVHNLSRLEDTLALLRPPKWPAAFFDEGNETAAAAALRQQRVARGKELYAAHCASCHDLVDRKDLATIVTAEMSFFDGTGKQSKTGRTLSAPGTDIWMACNSFYNSAASGVLDGFEGIPYTRSKIPTNAKVAELLRVTVTATLLGQKLNITTDAASKIFGADRTPQPDFEISEAEDVKRTNCLSASHPNLGYTSRPLNGIWASPPYLHNGSVPTIFDLLKPPAERPKEFYLGIREYDPIKVGYVQPTGNEAFKFRAADQDGNVVEGNSNAGHDYSNSDFSDEDRFAIIEYLKTL